MPFQSYLRAARSHPVLIAVVFVATVLGSVAWLVVRPTTYSSSSALVVTPMMRSEQFLSLPVVRDLGDPVRTIETAAALFESEAIARAAAESWIGMDAGDVEERSMSGPGARPT